MKKARDWKLFFNVATTKTTNCTSTKKQDFSFQYNHKAHIRHDYGITRDYETVVPQCHSMKIETDFLLYDRELSHQIPRLPLFFDNFENFPCKDFPDTPLVYQGGGGY